MSDQTTAKILLAGVIAAGSAIWGWYGWLVLLWCGSMALDYITGTCAALKEQRWSSNKAREGLWHKGGMVLIVLAAAMTDAAVSLVLRSGVVQFPVDHSIILSVIVLSWYTLTEIGSTVENATHLTTHVPRWLTRFLANAAEKVDAAGEVVAGKVAEHEQS